MSLSRTSPWLIGLLSLSAILYLPSEIRAQSERRPDILIADFEGENYGAWQATGQAFGDGPARGTLPGQMHVSGFNGNSLVNSFFNGDATKGTLTSPPFRLERNYITFLIGGGGYAGKTCMNLVVDGQVVRSSTGTNTQPGGSEALALAFWQVADLVGQVATIQIIDDATGGWGHINVDHLVQTDTKPNLPLNRRLEKSFLITDKYLVFPIQNKDQVSGQLQLFVEGQKVRQYDLNLAPTAATTDWYAFFTIENYQGRQARVVATQATEAGFELVRQSNTIPGEDQFNKEPHRPQFHFTQKVGWNNDPNGMVYQDGTWHLFFQHNPVALPWGNMTWGHATSNDLLHWQQQPDKLFPKTMAVGDCFSGSAVIDSQNTAGWGSNTLVVFLTDTGAGEAIAYSQDGGKSFTWYAGNPIIKHNGRDPKVIWYPYKEQDHPLSERAKQLGGHWLMVVYDEHPEFQRNIAIYTSTNLKEWTEQSHITGYFECPDLFELPVMGSASETRWVLFGADAKYALGRCDGTSFLPDHAGKYQVDWGPYYASQTFSNAPNDRRIQIGWIRVAAPGPYNQHFSFPHQLTLRRTMDGIRMFAQPIPEIEKLRTQSHQAESQVLLANQPVTLPVQSDLLDVRLTVELGTAQAIHLQWPGRSIRYDVTAQKLNNIPLPPIDGKIQIQVLADRSLTEIIGNEGQVYISGAGPAQQSVTAITLTSEGGAAKLLTLEAHQLQSIWQQ